MKIGDKVLLNPKIEDCEFYPILGQIEPMKALWYKNWWTLHQDKEATIVCIDRSTIHIQFDGEDTKYMVSEMYFSNHIIKE